MATDLITAPSSELGPTSELPAWVVPAAPEPEQTVVGINAEGKLYIYGETAQTPGPVVPAVYGCITNIAITQRGGGSRYGLRDYLDLRLLAPIPGTGFLLRLPCKGAPHPTSGERRTPWSVRSLLGALFELDLTATAVKLQTRRGNETTFFRVIPHTPDGIELPELRAEAIGPSRHDLEIAVNRIRANLNLQPAFL